MSNDCFSSGRRKALLSTATGVALAALTTSLPEAARAGAGASRAFPKGFRWGVSTAAHQIEGNNTNCDFWFLENIKPTTFSERSGDACDSYHRYEEDIALLAQLGFNS